MTTGPGDEKAAGGSGDGHLRVSHADREQVIATLKAAFIQGRLSRDELDLRVGRALGSRTYAELAALTADIPAGLTGLAAHNALQADTRPRRRARRIAGSLAAVAVIVATISVASLSHRPATVAAPGPAGAIMYVAASNGMTPVTTATNTPGKPIRDRRYPDGDRDHAGREDRLHRRRASRYGHTGRDRHQYAGQADHASAVSPGRSRSRRTGRPPTSLTSLPMVVAPARSYRSRPPPTRRAGRSRSAISSVFLRRSRSRRTGRPPTSSAAPIGEQRSRRSRPPPTRRASRSRSAAVPPGRPRSRSRRTGRPPTSSAPPLRRTTVTPVATATNTPGKPIKIGGIGRLTAETAIAITPDGKTAYIADGNHRTVIPVATATNTPGKPIKINGTPVAIAITPDGKTAYIATAAYIAGSCAGCSVGTVIPVATATDTPGRPIKIGRIPKAIAITPADGGGMLQKLLPVP